MWGGGGGTQVFVGFRRDQSPSWSAGLCPLSTLPSGITVLRVPGCLPEIHASDGRAKGWREGRDSAVAPRA